MVVVYPRKPWPSIGVFITTAGCLLQVRILSIALFSFVTFGFVLFLECQESVFLLEHFGCLSEIA